MNKLILQILDKDGNILEGKKYKSLRTIQHENGPDIDYFNWRAIWLLSMNKTKTKNIHPLNKKLYEKYRIIDDEPNFTI